MSIVGPGCDQLDAFFDGELPADEQESFREHLVACRRCQEVLGGRIPEELIVALGTSEHEHAEPTPGAGSSATEVPTVDPGEYDDADDEPAR